MRNVRPDGVEANGGGQDRACVEEEEEMLRCSYEESWSMPQPRGPGRTTHAMTAPVLR